MENAGGFRAIIRRGIKFSTLGVGQAGARNCAGEMV